METVIRATNVQICYKTGDFKDIGLKEWVMRHLTGRYVVNQFMAVDGVSFEINRGEMIGIIGANGAGKSTLLKAVSGIMEPTGGTIEREGKISALLELASGFDGNLTVKENAYLRGAMLGYTRAFMDRMYNDIIEFAELREFQDRPFKQLSSGMQSRLAFSIASLVQPDILILDEVLSVGDGSFQEKSSKKMMEIIQGGAATILVTHSLQQVRNLCSRALWLHRGKQMAFGDANEVCDQYEKYMNLDTAVSEAPPPEYASCTSTEHVPTPPAGFAYSPNEPINIGNKLLIHDADGHRVFLDPNEFSMTLHMIEHHVWEPHIRQVIAASVTAGSVYVDVGANIGLHSLYAAGFIGESGHVFAFEPNPSVMELLKANMEINGFYSRTTFIQKAVLDHEGTAEFYIHKDHDGMANLSGKQHCFEASVSAQEVEITTLRAAVPQDVKVDLLKIDVEDYEYDVLIGAGNILEQPDITVIFKWWPSRLENNAAVERMINFIQHQDFKVYLARYTEPLHYIDRQKYTRLGQLGGDIILTRRDHLEQLCR